VSIFESNYSGLLAACGGKARNQHMNVRAAAGSEESSREETSIVII
jgi:hypothetical protein